MARRGTQNMAPRPATLLSSRRREDVLSDTPIPPIFSPTIFQSDRPVEIARCVKTARTPVERRLRRMEWMTPHLFLKRCVEYAVDFHDIVVEQPPGLEHGPRRIGRLAPELGL